MNSQSERGMALVIVMLTIALVVALAVSLTIVTITESAIATNHRDATATLYAADAAVEFVLQELSTVPDWGALLGAAGQSAFVDGGPAGIRVVGALEVDLTESTLDVTTMATAPTGTVQAPSVLHAFGWFRDLVGPAAGPPDVYVAVWLADRSKAPKDDAAAPGALSVVGQAYGAQGSRRAVEVIVEKTDNSAVRVLAWRELL
jgi:hypothetical protein